MGFLFSKEVIAVPTSNVALNLHVGPWPMGWALSLLLKVVGTVWWM
ncbi:hypothetical protein COLO4_12621 [Corchorus olitorius]|uniref:Uncharacterized protein n=1 Tax=Corchorus olitorius TaxID=93759 RepID=A0A1R3K0C2_9ROSI|nr:hypothetical protein COLO4_12621 [Corchorus olitorius]